MPSTAPADAGSILDLAVLRLQQGVAPIAEASVLIKQVSKDLRNALEHKLFYAHAARALRVIAQRECENGEVLALHKDCEAAIAAGVKEPRCWPCYARHVLNGGNP